MNQLYATFLLKNLLTKNFDEKNYIPLAMLLENGAMVDGPG